jgi:hypothetical protein
MHGLLVCLLLVFAGCSRAAWVAFVPKLELRCMLQRADDTIASAGRIDATFGASLRWRPAIEARELPSPYAQSPAAWLVPCSDDDAECVREFVEAEAEVADAVRFVP